MGVYCCLDLVVLVLVLAAWESESSKFELT